MRKHLFYFLLLVSVVFTNAQITPEIQWTKLLGDSNGQSGFTILPTSDGGYLVGGEAGYSGDGDVHDPKGEVFEEEGWTFTLDYDYWVVKLDADSNIEWSKNYGGTKNDELKRISPAIGGGYYLGGNSHSNDGDVGGHHGSDTYSDFWIVKIDNQGEIIWEKNLGGETDEVFWDGFATEDGGYIAVGSAASNGGDVIGNHNSEGYISDGWVVKLDSLGNIEWQKPLGGLGSTTLLAIQPTKDGGYITVGETEAFGGDIPPTNHGSLDAWVVKLDGLGNIEWSKLFGGSNIDGFSSVKVLPDGSYIVAGQTDSNDGDVSYNHSTGEFLRDVWVVKLDIDGEIEWEKTYGGEGNEAAYQIHLTADCGYVLAGSYRFYDFEGHPNRGENDGFLMKIDTVGEIQWIQTIGGSLQDNLWNLALANDNGFITVGTTTSIDGDAIGNHSINVYEVWGWTSDIWVIKFNPDCIIPEFTTENPLSVCYGEDVTLTVNTEGQTIRWYESEDALEPFFTGSQLLIENITESVSYWVEVANCQCISERVEVIVNVNPVPELVIEEEEVEICSGNDAALYAFSEGNVIFWYENEEDEDYLYHGNNFIIEDLEEGTYTYWVEAYNMATGCASERIPVTITVNPVPDAPVVIEVYIAEEGQTLADLEEDIEFEGTLTWYADEFLTVELPNTTLVEDHTVYFVTQTINGCESEAAVIEVEFLGTSDVNNSAFAYYPNPVKDKLYFTGKEKVQSVQIFDASGKLIINKESKANGIQQLDVTILPKGTYIVKTKTEKEVKTFKIVKK